MKTKVIQKQQLLLSIYISKSFRRRNRSIKKDRYYYRCSCRILQFPITMKMRSNFATNKILLKIETTEQNLMQIYVISNVKSRKNNKLDIETYIDADLLFDRCLLESKTKMIQGIVLLFHLTSAHVGLYYSFIT